MTTESTLKRTLTDLRANRPLGGLARALRRRRGLVFVHVPKCGGTSVERALRRHFVLGRRMIHPETSFDAAQALEGFCDEEAGRAACLIRASEIRRDLLHLHLAEGATLITGHAPLGPRTIDAHGDSHDFVCLMRSPASRMRSHLAFNRSHAAGHGRSDISVTRFLETDRAKILGALYVKYLSGLPMNADLTSQSAIDAARRTVDRLTLVGFTDAMEPFSRALSDLIGARVRIGHANRGEEAALPTGAVERIDTLCAPDNAVYAHARARFAERRSSQRRAQA